ncbi:MAG: rhodanese-like domain-containing protein [Candidatus Dasytiphilus stammeri]
MQSILYFYSMHPILCLTWFLLMIIILYLTVKINLTKSKIINCNQAIILINKKNAQVIDLRSKEDYCKGHIYPSINILEQDIKNNCCWKELQKYKFQPIIIVGYGYNNLIDIELASKIIKLGVKQVYILEYGIIGWENAQLPLITS